MLAKVEEHVGQGRASFARRAERVGVVATGPDGAAVASRAVDGASAADREPLDATDERQARISFDDHVNMVGLHGELDDAE